MSMAIQAVSFTSNNKSLTAEQQDRRDKAAGAATAAGGTAYAAKMANNAAKVTNKAVKAEKAVAETMQTATKGAKVVSQVTKDSVGIFSKFKSNVKAFTADVINWFGKWQNNKILGPIIKSPITKKLASFIGGLLAVFVLISGINKMAENGAQAVKDAKNKYGEWREM